MTHRSRLRPLLALVALVALLVPLVHLPASSADAADARLFQPGNLISDLNFHDSSSMTVAQVQSFLDSKGSGCSSTSPKCLKDYTMDTTAHPDESGVKLCKAYPAKENQTAAQIIVAISKACGINPKVLLVLIEKEQSLVSTKKPTDYKYRYTTGWCVTDSGSCVGTQSGFSNQVYMSARQFLKYERSPGAYNIQPKTAENIRYNPKSSCGTKSVYVENQATANLYNYTPYVPNAAALANLYGSGDSCSAYGNRNFWRIYTDWFGSPTGGDSIVTADKKTYWVVSGNTRYRIADLPSRADLASLGTVTVISTGYLSSYADGGALSPLVQNSSTGKYYLLDSNRRLAFVDCAHVESLGWGCDGLPQLSSEQLLRFPSGGTVSQRIVSGGHTYYVADGVKREYSSLAGLEADVGVTRKASTLKPETIAHLPLEAPLLYPGDSVVDATGSKVYVDVGGTYYSASASLWRQSTLNRIDNPRLLSTASFALISAPKFGGIVRDTATGDLFAMTPEGKAPLTGVDVEGVTVRDATPEALAVIPTVAGLTEPFLARSVDYTRVYLFANGMRRPIRDAAQQQLVSAEYGAPMAVTTITDTAVAGFPRGEGWIVPGTVVKSNVTGAHWLIDGLTTKVPVSNAMAAELATKRPVVRDGRLNPYDTAASGRMGLKCGAQHYIQNGGILYRTNKGWAAEYRPAFTFAEYDASTCAGMKIATVKIGRFIKTSAGTYYVVDNGEKRKISYATYKKMYRPGKESPARVVTKYVLARIPTA